MRAKSAEGVVAIVTGGASGIGRAVARRLAEEGARAVVIADMSPEPREGGDTTVELVEERGAIGKFVQCDVRDQSQIAAVVAQADVHGGVTVLVNCAGVFQSGEFLDVEESTYDLVMGVNVKGTYFMTQAVGRSMVAGGRTGAIVNLSSIGGMRANPRYSVYNASKGAVGMFTYSVAGTLAPHGIRVNALHPGLVETRMLQTDVPVTPSEAAQRNPLGRNAEPDDIADAVLFLIGNGARFVNGASLVVDGGLVNTM